MQLLPNSSNSDFNLRDRDQSSRSVVESCERDLNLLETNEYIRAKSADGIWLQQHSASAVPLEDRVEIECDPNLAIAYNQCAHSSYPLHDYPAALAAIDLAILLQRGKANESNPKQAALYYQRALIAKALNDYPQVLADCQQVLSRDPQHQTVRGLYAIALVRTRDYQAALASFDRHIELYPQDPHGYCYRGICYEQLKEHTRALADFNLALDLKPGAPVFHHARGRTYQQLGNFSAALADYEIVIQTTPLVAKVYDDRAEIHRLQGDYPQAIADCTQSILLNPDRIDAYFRRGIIHAELGDLDLALVDYDRIISLDPAHVRTYIQRSWIYFRQDKYPLAIQDCESIVNSDKFCFWAHYLLGVMNTRSGFKHRAIANFTRAIEISPNYVSARYHRGVIYHELGNTTEAILDFNQARAIQDLSLEKLIDRDETGFYAEGLALYYTGQKESAITMLKLALLVAKRFNNPSFQEQILLLLQRFSAK
jgi:tetratricopeptide (TPR) repeat protein